MSQADITFITKRLERYKNEFRELVGVKKSPAVIKERTKLKSRITTLNKWLKDLEELNKQKP